MSDIFTPEQRSLLMSKVKGRNTKPEWMLRSSLHRLGYRYRIHLRTLPGSPDLVLPKYKTVIFVHGCFWHRHEGCSKSTYPKTNKKFWVEKLRSNVERDNKNIAQLKKLGWKVLVVWECELKKDEKATIKKVVDQLSMSLNM